MQQEPTCLCHVGGCARAPPAVILQGGGGGAQGPCWHRGASEGLCCSEAGDGAILVAATKSRHPQPGRPLGRRD